MRACVAPVCGVVGLGLRCAAWCRSVLLLVVLCPSGCFVRCVAGARRRHGIVSCCFVWCCAPRGALCGVWREPAASMTLCRAASCSVVPLGVLCAVFQLEPAASRQHVCVPLCASMTPFGMIVARRTSDFAGAWLGPGVCLVQAALRCAARVNHVVGVAGAPSQGGVCQVAPSSCRSFEGWLLLLDFARVTCSP
jgi:hypothetical protein